MSVDWSPLDAELERLEAPLPVWWRDDDAVAVTPGLDRLAGLAADHGWPLHLAIIPAGADGIDVNLGFSTPHLEEAALNRTMLKMAKKVILVMDSSKFKKRSLAVIGQINEVDILVTDKGITEEDKEKLLNAGVEVIITE